MIDLFIQNEKAISNKIISAPLHTVGYICEYNASAFKEDLFELLKINQPRELKRSSKKRKAEFLAGRYAASLALNEISEENINVGVSMERYPIWPAGVVGSITHSSKYAMCMISNKSKPTGIGIDLEPIIGDDLLQDIRTHLVNKNENAILISHKISKNLLVTLIFSAKESLFKTLYPLTHVYFDFSDAEMIAINHEEKTISLKLLISLNDKIKKNDIFIINFSIYKNNVITYHEV